MGLFDKIRGALYEQTGDTTTVPAPKREAQIPLQTNGTIQPIQFNNSLNPGGSANMFMPQQSQPVVSPEYQSKMQEYFGGLYTAARKNSSEYATLLTNIETLIESDPNMPDANKFKTAFIFMKKQGITKEALLNSTNVALTYVDADRKNSFDVDIAKKNAIIDNNSKAIEDKKVSIQKLYDEITQLQSNSEETKQKISQKTLCYNTLSAQLLEKIKSDITGIMSFIS